MGGTVNDFEFVKNLSCIVMTPIICFLMMIHNLFRVASHSIRFMFAADVYEQIAHFGDGTLYVIDFLIEKL